MLSNPPPLVTKAGMFHLVGALPQLKSYSDTGPTIYALTVIGAKHDKVLGAASIAGPALDLAGLEADWPAEAKMAATAIFGRSLDTARRGGAIIVIVTVQIGRVSHCSIVNVPGDTPRRCRRWDGAARPAPPQLPRGGARTFRNA